MADNKILATAPIRGLLLRLAFPAIIAQIVNVLYNIVDRMFIGHIEGIGAEALTGVGVAMPVIIAISRLMEKLFVSSTIIWNPIN